MNNLNHLLERFYRSLNGDERRKETIATIIESRTGGKISKEEIFYKEGVLEIEASAVLKNEMKLKEREILQELNSNSIRVSRVLYR